MARFTMGEFCLRYRFAILLTVAALTAVFGAAAFVGLTTDLPQASMDARGEAFNLQQTVNQEFPPTLHIVPMEVFVRDGTQNVLTKDVLTELYEKSESLRQSSVGQEFLREFTDPQLAPYLGDQAPLGFLTIADIVHAQLKRQGFSLASASAAEVDRTVANICSSIPYGPFFRAQFSIQTVFERNTCTTSAFSFFVYVDNERLGGGPFERSVGADPITLEKERFNRDLQTALQGDSYELLGIGIDLNLQAIDEGFSYGTTLRIVGTIVFLALFVGFMLRSWRMSLMTLMGLFTLIVWIRGFPVIVSSLTEGFVKPSLTTDIILPIAFVAFAVDFIVHVGSRYREEWHLDVSARTAMSHAFTGVAAAITFAAATDAIAFASNAVSSVEAVVSFGIVGWFAAVASFLIMGIAIPLFLMMWDEKRPARFTPRDLPVVSIVQKILKYQIPVLIFIVLMTAGSVWGITKLDTNLDPRDFISNKSNFVRSLDKRGEHFVDISGRQVRGEEVIIYIEGNLDDPVVDSAIREALTNLADNEFLAQTAQGLVFPRSAALIKGDHAASGQIVVELTGTRKLAQVQAAKSQIEHDLLPLAGVVEAYGITGPPFTRLESLNAVTGSLTKTLAAAGAVILVFLWVAFRSLRFAILTMLPMGFVIIWTYGLMGVAGFSLNFITATIAAVSVGVGIDYSVHLVQRFRQESRKMPTQSAIEEAWQHTGFPVAVAAISSIGGFLILATAPMPMFSAYGILAASMIAFSFVAAMTVLPILILHISPKQK